MKVVCKFKNINQINDIDSIKRLRKSINLSDNDDLGLEIGQIYFVYGIIFWDNTPWFYICENEDDEYPKPVAADFFDIIDQRMPTEWQLAYRCIGVSPRTEIVFSEWAKDPMFYERLVDGVEEQLKIFQKYKTQFIEGKDNVIR